MDDQMKVPPPGTQLWSEAGSGTQDSQRGTSVDMRPGGLRCGDAGELRISRSSKGPLLVKHGERGGRL